MKEIFKSFIILFVLLFSVSFYSIQNVEAKYITGDFSNEECTTRTIPKDATTSYEIVKSKPVATGYTYQDYLETTKVIDNHDGTFVGHANIELENVYVFFKISNDKKSIIAYVPNYKSTLSNKKSLNIIKFLGLYNEKQTSCKDTYIANAKVVYSSNVSDDANQNSEINKTITTNNYNVTDNNNDNNSASVSNNSNSNSNPNQDSFGIKLIISIIIIIISIILIFIVFKDKKKSY